MYTITGLLDFHARSHQSLAAVLDHLETLPVQDQQRPVDGFSYPTVVAQAHHVIAAERYWFGVLQGTIRVDDDADEHQTVPALRSMRETVAAATASYLRSLSDAEASTPRTVKMFNGREIDVTPAHVLLRTQTHAYQHQGEIAAMTRLLGHRFPSGLDLPLNPTPAGRGGGV